MFFWPQKILLDNNTRVVPSKAEVQVIKFVEKTFATCLTTEFSTGGIFYPFPCTRWHMVFLSFLLETNLAHSLLISGFTARI